MMSCNVTFYFPLFSLLDSLFRRLPEQRDRKLLIDTIAYADDEAFVTSFNQEAFRKLKTLPEVTQLTGLIVSFSKTELMRLEQAPPVEVKCADVARQPYPY